MKFEKGDRVRIRSWESMEDEFGLDVGGNIACPGCFTKGMRYLCGHEFFVAEITKLPSGAYSFVCTGSIILTPATDEEGNISTVTTGRWVITRAMLEPVKILSDILIPTELLI